MARRSVQKYVTSLHKSLVAIVVLLLLDTVLFVVPYILEIAREKSDFVQEEVDDYKFETSLVDLLILWMIRSILLIWGLLSMTPEWKPLTLAFVLICSVVSIVKASLFHFSEWAEPAISYIIVCDSIVLPLFQFAAVKRTDPTVMAFETTRINTRQNPNHRIQQKADGRDEKHPINIDEELSDGFNDQFFTPPEGSLGSSETDPVGTPPPEPITPAEQGIMKDCKTLVSTWKSLIEEAKSAFADERLFAASSIIHSIQNALNQHKDELERAYAEEKHSITSTLASPTCQSILTEEAAARRLLTTFESSEGWELFYENEGIKTWFQGVEGNPAYSFKIEGMVHAPLVNVVGICYEVDLYPKWIPAIGPYGLKVAKELAKLSRVSKIVYLDIAIPWPIANRDIAMVGKGTDIMLETGHIILTLKSVNEYPGVQFPPVSGSTVRADCHFGGFLLSPVSENETMLRMMFNVDPKLSYTPYWLLNWTLKQFAHHAFYLLRTQAENVAGTEYEARIKSSPDPYKDIDDRVNGFLDRKRAYQS